MNDKVTVIIPTYNRFDSLQLAIISVKNQTYKNIEIIVVNDNSTDIRYYNTTFTKRKDVKIVNISPNSRELFDFPIIPNGITRNIGLNYATGEYIAFLDDDDYWLPTKLELQINKMIEFNCYMSCTEGLYGIGSYIVSNIYQLYNKGKYYDTLLYIYKTYNIELFPTIWDLNFLKIHNCCITSSVVIKKSLLDKERFKPVNNAEDYDLWLRILLYTNCVYVDEPLVYYSGRK